MKASNIFLALIITISAASASATTKCNNKMSMGLGANTAATSSNIAAQAANQGHSASR